MVNDTDHIQGMTTTNSWEYIFDGKWVGNERLCCNGDYCGANCAAKTGEEIKLFIHSLLTTQRKELAEKSGKLASALLSMYDQYCAERGHLFMQAGEEASAVLEEYEYATFDAAGRLLEAKD